jgi:hypothetical protein
MKSVLSFVFLAVFSLAQLAAQESTFNKGDKVLNLGIGFGTSLYSGSYYSVQIPPVSASLEFGVADNILEKGYIGVGPVVGFASYKYEYSDWGWKYSNFLLAFRGYFHYPLVKKLDTYTGLALGYNIVSSKEFGTYPGYDYTASSSSLVWAWFVGGRYYFKESFAVYAELGYGVAYFNIGVAFKI